GDTPAAVGNRIANNTLNFGFADGSNELNNYAPVPSYTPINQPLIVALPGNNVNMAGDPTLVFRNRWQPLALSYFIDQNGNPVPTGSPSFSGPHWGRVYPFALPPAALGPPYVYHDPGPPPYVDGVGDAEYKSMFAEDVHFSSMLTPDDGVMMDI